MARRKMTRTEIAELYARAALWRRKIASAVRRCRATGLDEASYAGLLDAGLALAPWFTVPAGSLPRFRTDRAFIEALVSIEGSLAVGRAALEGCLDAWHLDLIHARDLISEGHRSAGLAVAQDAAAALEIGEDARDRLTAALAGMLRVHDQLAEVYQDIYAHVREGHVLPYNARWITGETTPAPVGAGMGR